MFRLLSDENISSALIREILHAFPEVDLVRVSDVGLRQASDEEVIDWAYREKRILITHDRKTIPDIVRERYLANQPVGGIVLIQAGLSIIEAVEDLGILLHCMSPEEMTNMVQTIPF